MSNYIGKVVQVIGPVVDVRFENGKLPLKTITQEGIVTSYDENSKYITWEINGISQPIVNINSVSFIL